MRLPSAVARLAEPGALLACIPWTGVSAQRGVDPDRVRESLERVFADPDLQRGLRDAHDDSGAFVDYLIQKISRWFREIVDWLDRLRGDSPILFWLLMAGLIVLAGLLLWHIVWTFSLAFRAAPAGEIETRGDDAIQRALRFRELRRRAAALAQDGDHREAVRMLFLALLALFEERRVLQVAQSWTTREILARLRAPVASTEDLQKFSSRFEASRYGRAQVAPAEYQEMEGWVDDMAASVPRLGARS